MKIGQRVKIKKNLLRGYVEYRCFIPYVSYLKFIRHKYFYIRNISEFDKTIAVVGCESVYDETIHYDYLDSWWFPNECVLSIRKEKLERLLGI